VRPSEEEGGALCEVTVSEIHRYPLRPEGFEEPLFPTAASKRAVLEHLLEASWLSRASELREQSGYVGAAKLREEPVELVRCASSVHVVRPHGGRCSWRRRRLVEVLARWRCVSSWWDRRERVDRLVFRVRLSGDAVVDLALERSGGWLLAGVVD
jgi:hypothetical protein